MSLPLQTHLIKNFATTNAGEGNTWEAIASHSLDDEDALLPVAPMRKTSWRHAVPPCLF